MSIFHCKSIKMTENKEKDNRSPLITPVIVKKYRTKSNVYRPVRQSKQTKQAWKVVRLLEWQWDQIRVQNSNQQ